MADSDDDGSMSIVPYNQRREIVLRHNDAVVVYDRGSQQLQLENATQTEAERLPGRCPYCHRTFGDDHESEGEEEGRRGSSPSGYVDPNYFAMLDSDQSPPGSRRVTRASSRRQLAPYVLDEREEEHAAANHLVSAGISPESFNDGFFKRNFIEEGILGRGGRGVVMLVKHVLGSHDLGQFACKRVPVGDSPEWLRKVLVEVQTLKTLSHHNLAPYHHAWLEHAQVSNFGPTVPCVFILQRYCEAGDLQQYVCGSARTEYTPQQLKARMRRRSKGEPESPSGLPGPRRLNIEMIYSLFKDINHGLRYLHNKNLIHRDLKPSNCLLTLEGNKLRCVVSDFGEVQPEDAVRSSTGSTGTVSYCAPEVLQRVLPGGPFGNFTYKSDIFSLGMILYFLCFSTLPYRNADVLNEDNEDLDRLREEICQWSGFDDSHRPRLDLPDKVYWLLARLLSLHPEQRPSSKEIFELMKKHNNWDTPSDDRRSSIGNVFDMPLVPNSSRGRTGSTSTIRQDTFNAEKGSTNRTSERDMLTSRAVTSSRDYGSTGVSSPESTGDDRSLVLSRRHPSVPLSGPSEQHHWHHNEEDGEGPAGGQQSIRNWGLFNKRNATSPDQTSAPYDDDLAVVPSDQAASLDSVLFTRPAVAQLMAFVLFLLKIFSITIPCSPQAAQPWIFYPLLIIAAVDFGLRSLSLHVLALVFHGLVVWFARGMGNLCVSPR